MKIINLMFLSIVFLCLSCSNQKQSVLYFYADGSGNSYKITYTDNIKTVYYNPVKKHESSSGEYSGGVETTKEITESEYNSIKEKINNAITNKSIQNERREMGTGLISIESDKEKITYIIKYNSKEQKEIEQLLKSIISK